MSSTTFEATQANPGPDGNRERLWRDSVAMELRDAQVVGRPYRYLEGRAVPFNTEADIGWFLEQHAPGSFVRSTKGAGKNLPLLLFHNNRSIPVGHAEQWHHEDDALRGVWRLSDRPEAQEAAQAAVELDLVGLSIGFQPIRSDWELVDDWAPELGPEHKDRVTRTESRLIEVSMTPTPAFVDAQVTEVRDAAVYHRARAELRTAAHPELDPDTWRAELDALRSRSSA
jgi:HK97 family phage prohead protease